MHPNERVWFVLRQFLALVDKLPEEAEKEKKALEGTETLTMFSPDTLSKKERVELHDYLYREALLQLFGEYVLENASKLVETS